MSRFFAYICNDDNLTSPALSRIASSVRMPSTAESAGYGVGWVHRGQSLLRTSPKGSNSSPELFDLLSDIRSRTLLGHVRESGDESAVQPFRFRKWVFAHGGEEPERAVLDQLLLEVPDLVASNVKGTSAAETIGHVFLGELHRRNLLEAKPHPRQVADAMAAAVRLTQLQATVAELGLVAISSRTLVAASTGHPLYYRVQRGLEVREEPMFAGHRPRPTNHPTFKSVMVTNAEVDGDEWQGVPDGHVIWVDDGSVETAPIAE